MKHQDSVNELQGPCSAIFTPFDGSNNVNHEMLDKLVEFQLARGIQGFFVAGTTGEGLLLSSSERTAIVRQVVQACSGRAKVIAHVGHASTEESIELAKQSATAGADWIASIPPLFYGKSFNGTFRHYQAIAGATDLPFMIYAMGTEVNCQRDQAFFDIPNVCGLKYTGADFFSVQQFRRSYLN